VDFTNLNNRCPKDLYQLHNIDMMMNNASGCGMLNIMDAYSGYNQIAMHPSDEEKS